MKISVIKIFLAVFVISSTITPSSAVEGRPSQPVTGYAMHDLSALLYQELRIGLQQRLSRCERCNRPFPWKREMSALLETETFAVLTTDKPAEPQRISRLFNSRHVSYYSAGKAERKSAKKYGVKIFPERYLVNKNNVSVDSYSVPGTDSDENADNNIRKTFGHVIDASG